jgi:formiminoglutamase
VHENYTSKSVLDIIKTEDRVRYTTYDSLKIRKEKDFNLEMFNALEFIKMTVLVLK